MTESTSDSSASLIICLPSFSSPSTVGQDCVSGSSPSAWKTRLRFSMCCWVSRWCCCKSRCSFGSEASCWRISSIPRMVSSIVRAAPSLCTNSSCGVSMLAIRPPSFDFRACEGATRRPPGETLLCRYLRQLVAVAVPAVAAAVGIHVLTRIPGATTCAGLGEPAAEHVRDRRERGPLPEEACVDARRDARGDPEAHQQEHVREEFARHEERASLRVVDMPAPTGFGQPHAPLPAALLVLAG